MLTRIIHWKFTAQFSIYCIKLTYKSIGLSGIIVAPEWRQVEWKSKTHQELVEGMNCKIMSAQELDWSPLADISFNCISKQTNE